MTLFFGNKHSGLEAIWKRKFIIIRRHILLPLTHHPGSAKSHFPTFRRKPEPSHQRSVHRETEQ